MTPAKSRWRYKCAVRSWYEAYKANSKCAGCGCTDTDKLQFHHRNGSNKDDNVARLVQQARSVRTIQREIRKCVILCETCHAQAHGMSDVYELRARRKEEASSDV